MRAIKKSPLEYHSNTRYCQALLETKRSGPDSKGKQNSHRA